MSLSVNFGLTAELRDALVKLRENASKFRGLIVVVKGETLDCGSELISASDDVAADYAQIRAELGKHEAAFVVATVDQRLTLVTFTPESLKPRQRMIYASCSSHLRDQGKIHGDKHVASIDEVVPQLFGNVPEEKRVEVMTETEVAKKKIESLQAQDAAEDGGKPRVHAMHGMSTSMSGDALQSAKEVLNKERECAVFKLSEGAVIAADGVSALANIEASEEPRFIVARVGEPGALVLIYVVPEGSKPKVRMQYAACKPALVTQLKSEGFIFERSLEKTDFNDLQAQVKSSLNAAPIEDTAAPVAPAPKAFMKGPRMFMPS